MVDEALLFYKSNLNGLGAGTIEDVTRDLTVRSTQEVGRKERRATCSYSSHLHSFTCLLSDLTIKSDQYQAAFACTDLPLSRDCHALICRGGLTLILPAFVRGVTHASIVRKISRYGSTQTTSRKQLNPAKLLPYLPLLFLEQIILPR
jgi:hypothetical protein